MDTASAQAIDALRAEFGKHEALDQVWFREVREDINRVEDRTGALEVGMANLQGRLAVLGIAAMIVIPALTEIANVWVAAHFGGK